MGGNYSGSPVIIGDFVYCIAEDGTVVVLAASERYQLVARNRWAKTAAARPPSAATGCICEPIRI